jgi:hypothetical protein
MHIEIFPFLFHGIIYCIAYLLIILLPVFDMDILYKYDGSIITFEINPWIRPKQTGTAYGSTITCIIFLEYPFAPQYLNRYFHNQILRWVCLPLVFGQIVSPLHRVTLFFAAPSTTLK